MKKEIVTTEIVDLVNKYCAPRGVTALMNELRRSDALESRLAGGGEGKARARRKGPEVSLHDPEKLDRLITLCHQRLTSEDLCQVLLGMGEIFKVHGETNRAEELYTMALAQGEKRGESAFVAEAYMRRGEIYSRTAQWKQSTADLGRSRAIFAALKHYESLGRVENILGTNHAERGKLALAVKFFERALALFERSRETRMAGVTLMNLGITYNIVGDYDAAVAHYKRAQSYFENVGDVSRLGELRHNTGMTYLSKRMFKEAIREFNASHLLSSSSRNIALMGLASLGKATAYYHLRDLPLALKLVTQSIESFTKSGDRLSLADSYKVKGMIHRDMESFDSAASYLQTSLRINTEMHNPLNIAESHVEIGVLEMKRGKKEEAMQSFQKASVAYRRLGARKELKKVQDQMDILGTQRR